MDQEQWNELSPEEKEEIIAKNKAEHAQRFEKIRAAREAAKVPYREALEWLQANEVEFFYEHDFIFDRTISVAIMETGRDGRDADVEIAWTLLSPLDSFSKTQSRLILANRLRGRDDSCYGISTVVNAKLLEGRRRMFLRKAAMHAILQEIYSFPEKFPGWLRKDARDRLRLERSQRMSDDGCCGGGYCVNWR